MRGSTAVSRQELRLQIPEGAGLVRVCGTSGHSETCSFFYVFHAFVCFVGPIVLYYHSTVQACVCGGIAMYLQSVA